ncbi:tetratricopeptide repeat protein [Actinokineospora enzanensis]|uniref:tetratricopeptide repeat protein n=1 Tax=Actinokineospora enzanensis TaxID=155975 RepID=UPI0003A2499D|nr:tetratricopeptide repeat protein [Actinokineospora enzanensis]
MTEPIDAVLVEAAQLTAVGRPADAIALLRPVLVVHPDNPEAWCRLAAALLDAGDYQLCLDAAKRAITLGERSWAHRLASLSLSELGRHDEAVVSAREAARRDPQDWRSQVTLSEVLGPRSPHEALAAARHAVTMAPEVPRTHEILGLAADRVHDQDLARRAYTDALLLDPGNTEVRAKLDGLTRAAPAPVRPPRRRGFARRLSDSGEWAQPARERWNERVLGRRPEAEPRPDEPGRHGDASEELLIASGTGVASPLLDGASDPVAGRAVVDAASASAGGIVRDNGPDSVVSGGVVVGGVVAEGVVVGENRTDGAVPDGVGSGSLGAAATLGGVAARDGRSEGAAGMDSGVSGDADAGSTPGTAAPTADGADDGSVAKVIPVLPRRIRTSRRPALVPDPPEPDLSQSDLPESDLSQSGPPQSGPPESDPPARKARSGAVGVESGQDGPVRGGAQRTAGESEERAARPWTVEAEWRQRMSSVWPVPADPDDADEIEPLIEVRAEPRPETRTETRTEPRTETQTGTQAGTRPGMRAEPPVRPRVERPVEQRSEPITKPLRVADIISAGAESDPTAEIPATRVPAVHAPEDRTAEMATSGAPAEERPRIVPGRRRPRRPVRASREPVEPVSDPGSVGTAERKMVFGRAQRIALWLIMRRSSGWLAVGGFVLWLAGRPDPSPLLGWFSLTLLVVVIGAAAVGYRAIPANNRLEPRELARRLPLLMAGVALLAVGTLALAVWTLALALGAGGTFLLLGAAVPALASWLVGWVGLWRIRTAAR